MMTSQVLVIVVYEDMFSISCLYILWCLLFLCCKNLYLCRMCVKSGQIKSLVSWGGDAPPRSHSSPAKASASHPRRLHLILGASFQWTSSYLCSAYCLDPHWSLCYYRPTIGCVLYSNSITPSNSAIKLCILFSPSLKFQAVHVFTKMLQLPGNSIPRPPIFCRILSSGSAVPTVHVM